MPKLVKASKDLKGFNFCFHQQSQEFQTLWKEQKNCVDHKKLTIKKTFPNKPFSFSLEIKRMDLVDHLRQV